MRGIGCFLLSFFVVFDISNAKAFINKPTVAQLTKEPQSFSKKLSTKNEGRAIEDALSSRGGALLPVEPTAKILTLLGVTSNLHLIFFPVVNGKFFNLPMSQYLNFKRRYIAYSGLAQGLAAAFLLFPPKNSISVPTAAMVGFSILFAPFAMSKDPTQQAFAALIGGIVLTYLLGGLTSKAQQLVKVIAFVGFGWSFLLAYFPPMEKVFISSSTKQQIQGKEIDDDKVVAFFNRFLGNSNMSFFLFVLLISGGMNTCPAIGYSVIPSLVNILVQNLVTNDVKNNGVDVAGQLLVFFFLITTVVILTS